MDGLRQKMHALNDSTVKPALQGIKIAAGKTADAVGHAGAAVGAGVQAAADRVGLGEPVRNIGQGVLNGANLMSDAVHRVAEDLHGNAMELEALPLSMKFEYKANGEFVLVHEQSQAVETTPGGHRQKVGMSCSRQELEDVFGTPVRLYYNFLSFISCVNVVFVAISLIAWVPHCLNTFPRMRDEGMGWRQAGDLTMTQFINIFAIASFQPSSDAAWSSMVWLSSIGSLLVGPLYFCTSLFYFQDASKEQLVEKTIRGTPLDRRPGPEVSVARRMRRFLLSYSLFLLCFSIPIGCMYFLLFNLTTLIVEGQFELFTANDFAFGFGLAELLVHAPQRPGSLARAPCLCLSPSLRACARSAPDVPRGRRLPLLVLHRSWPCCWGWPPSSPSRATSSSSSSAASPTSSATPPGPATEHTASPSSTSSASSMSWPCLLSPTSPSCLGTPAWPAALPSRYLSPCTTFYPPPQPPSPRARSFSGSCMAGWARSSKQQGERATCSQALMSHPSQQIP